MLTYPVDLTAKYDIWDINTNAFATRIKDGKASDVVNRSWPTSDGMEIPGLSENLVPLLRVMADNPVYDSATQRIGAYSTPIIDLVAQTSTYTREIITLTQAELDGRADNLRAELWQSFDEYARGQTDDNSRTSINLIALRSTSTPQQLQRAADWGNWWNTLWYVYAVKRATLQATGVLPETDFAAEVGTAPWTIWEIAS